MAAGGAFSVESTEELTERLDALVGDVDARRRAGEAARRYVENGVGAAARGAALVETLLGR